MKKNKIALLLVFILGSATVWFVINIGTSTINEGLRAFSIHDTAAISKICLTDKNGTIVLERQMIGNWKLNDKNSADYFAIKKLLYTINKLEVCNPVGKNNEDEIVKNLVKNAVKCDIYQNGEHSKSYLVGNATPDNMGTYMVLINEETLVPKGKPFITCVPGYNNSITSHYSTNIKKWRDKTVFCYNENDIYKIKVEMPQHPENSYELMVKGKNYQLIKLTDNKTVNNVDTATIKQYLTYFFNLNFLSIDSTQTISQDIPLSIITVTDAKGIANKVCFFLIKKGGGLKDEKEEFQVNPLQLKALLDNGEIVLVQLYLFGKIMPDVSYFYKK